MDDDTDRRIPHGPESGDDVTSEGTGETVGTGDVEADAARSGADADTSNAPRDSDGVPTGADDADEDAAASGADSR